MKLLFGAVETSIRVDLPDEFVKVLPDKVAVFTTIQYYSQLDKWMSQLEMAGKHPLLIQTTHTRNKGQILGCNIEDYKSDAEAFAYIGDGVFHPKALLFHNSKPVFVFQPEYGRVFELEKESVEDIERKNKKDLMRFFAAKTVGVLLTTKYGQREIQAKMDELYRLSERFPDKKFYFLLNNNIDFQGLEDFPFCDVFLNTACPRIGHDDSVRTVKPLINLMSLNLMLEGA